MGDAYIVRRGGGGEGFSKCTIIVHVEHGSTVAAYSNPSATTKVKDATEVGASGSYIITGLNTGTYYVKASKGADSTTSSAITFTTDAVKEVTLSYELTLFENGDKTSVTGGWDVVSGATKVLSTSAVGFTYSGGGESSDRVVRGIRTINKISVSNYSTLKATFTSSTGDPQAKLVVCSSTDMKNIVASANITDNTTISVTLPTSGTYYVGIIADYTEYGVYSYNVRASKVWLE